MVQSETNILKGRVPHNFGIDILRVWMCFEVVLNHFWTYVSTGHSVASLPFDILLGFLSQAVPCFMFVSFLLCAGRLNNPDISKRDLSNRIKRIVIPILFWGIGYYLVLNLCGLISGDGLRITFSDLILQLLCGHVYNAPMWFMNVLLALTLTVVLINRLFPRKQWLRVNIIITVLSLIFCISGLNYHCFENLSFELRYPIGRYFETLPYAGIANIVYLTGIKIPQGRARIRSICVLTVCCMAGWMLRLFDWPETFQCGAPYQYTFSIPFVMLMCILPFQRIAGILRKTITPLAHYTLGIYCIHSGLGNLINELCAFIGWPQDTLTGCLIIFLTGYIICRLLAHIPLRWVKQSVS